MSERFNESELYPMLPSQADTCGICFQWSDGYPLCHACKAIAETLSDAEIEARGVKVLPISLAAEWDALATALWRYKNAEDARLRTIHSRMVENLLHDYVAQHGKCLGIAAGGAKFDLITWVPSAQGGRIGQKHPLADMVTNAPWNFSRATELLRRTPATVDKHRIDLGRFDVMGRVAGKAVLVIDDTWTTGSNAMSAVWSLQNAGAASVSVIVVGRWHNPNYRDYGNYSRHAMKVGFRMDACVYCDERPGLTIERTEPPRQSPPANDPWASPDSRDEPPF